MTSGDHVIRNSTADLRGILRRAEKERRPLTEKELRECNRCLQEIEFCFTCMHEHRECLVTKLFSLLKKKEA